MVDPEAKDKRVAFQEGYPVSLIAIDGTWTIRCTLTAVSADDAVVRSETTIEQLRDSEFFLVLSTMGTAHRRCKLGGVSGDDVLIRFIE